MFRRLIALCFLLQPLSSQAADASGHELAIELLARTGTAAIFGAGAVQAAVADPRPFLGDAGKLRRQRLLEESGFREWQPPRVWVLQARREGTVERWAGMAPPPAARGRGLRFVSSLPLPAAEQAIAFLVPGQPSAALASLLGAYEADALMLLRGNDWSLWIGNRALQGVLPAGTDLLPEVLAETLASLQQWPEAAGRAVVKVEGVGGVVDMAGVLGALQALPGVRQPQLMRATRDCLWFALAAPAAAALPPLLDGEPRLPAAAPAPVSPGVSAATLEAWRLASPLLQRQWRPEAARPPADGPAPVQSPPL